VTLRPTRPQRTILRDLRIAAKEYTAKHRRDPERAWLGWYEWEAASKGFLVMGAVPRGDSVEATIPSFLTESVEVRRSPIMSDGVIAIGAGQWNAEVVEYYHTYDNPAEWAPLTRGRLAASVSAAIDECDAYGEAQQKQIATAAAELRKLLVTHGSVVTSSTPPPKSGVALVFQYELQQETDRARRDPSYVPPMCTNPPPPPWPSVGDTWTDAHTYRRWQYAGSLRGWVEEQGAAYTVAPTPLTPSWMKIGDTYYGITPDGQWGIVDAPETNPQQSGASEGKSYRTFKCACSRDLDERDCIDGDLGRVRCFWCGTVAKTGWK
jgi:hypothetical protein